MKLSDAKSSDIVFISKILGHGSFRKRITEMGFVRGKEARVVKITPLKGPIEVRILNYNVSLRHSEAEMIEVTSHYPDLRRNTADSGGLINGPANEKTNGNNGKTINVALVGNPNSGKTSLYNILSGSKEKVGNYNGVTIETAKTTFTWGGYNFNIYDLPGSYSLSALSTEELLVRKFIYEEAPDIVLNVLDATNLERNLFLTTQLIDMDLRVVAVLNMVDELEKKLISIDHDSLSLLLGIPIVPLISTRGTGMKELLARLIEVFEGRDECSRHIHIDYGKNLEAAIGAIREKTGGCREVTDLLSPRFIALKLLENDDQVNELISGCEGFREIRTLAGKEARRIQNLMKEDIDTIISNARYGFITGALKETMHQPSITFRSQSEKIDHFLTHPVWGLPLFAAILFLVFYATFKLGAYPMYWIDKFIQLVSGFSARVIPDGMLKDMLIEGIISGTGSVLVFLPNIVILFFLLSLLEETGYMARASFIMDKTMHLFGLHGRSFIPMVLGFGCNVPAIMATRNLRNRGDRILTMLIIPFMSCNARMPVYILLISAFFNSYRALILVAVYATGIFIAFLTARFLNKTFFRNNETPFVMELPTYRLPALKNVGYQMWDKTKQYLKKIGGIILIGVIIIWALEYFPLTGRSGQATLQHSTIPDVNAGKGSVAWADHGSSGKDHGRQISDSYLGRIGKFIMPVMQPLGFDWKMSISLLSGLPAKEIIVSTMGVLYHSEEGNIAALREKLTSEVHESGKLAGRKVFTRPAALSCLIFILIYFPCIGVVAAIKNESGHWKWALFSVVYTTLLAWLAAFTVYNIAGIFFN